MCYNLNLRKLRFRIFDKYYTMDFTDAVVDDSAAMPPPALATVTESPAAAVDDSTVMPPPSTVTATTVQDMSDSAAMPPPPPVKAESQEPKQDDALRNALLNIPTRQYLDQTVVPLLLQALGNLARERPTNPIQYLGEYFLREKDRYQSADATQQ